MYEDDGHYYLTGYSVSDDPYVLPNGVLINRLGFTTTAELNAAETELVTIRAAIISESPIRGQFDLAHLQAIHAFLFQDIYPWAGELRVVDIGKNATAFLRHQDIPEMAARIHDELHQEQLLTGLDARTFSERAAYYLARINLMHPFREGNGRAQREFIQQLANGAGYFINWAGVSQEAMKQACIASIDDNDLGPLRRIIQVGLETL
ncbi:Fic/DOC family protein [Perlucidibaca piscinae]|uniref:Fic/DOC family protein n=1 Tax=Perlucidibaca piscinae TaxID=392589 RepID=UPI0003B79ACA|nr:Fic family protein [Perlucidibaca piscinae]